MKQQDTIEVTVTNWEKYNAKNDNKKHSWFRLDNNFFLDEALFGLGLTPKCTYLYLMCSCSRSGLARVRLNLAQCCTILGSKKSLVIKALGELKKSGLIEFGIPTDVTDVTENISDLEKSQPTKVKTEIGEKPTFCLKEIWNLNRGTLPEIRRLTPSRETRIRALLKEFPEQEFWIDLIKKMNMNPFLTGTNDRGWKADFDFLLQPKSFTRLIEGYYDKSSNEPKVIKLEI